MKWINWSGYRRRYVVLFHLVMLTPLVGALTISFHVTPDDLESGAIRLTPPCLFKTMTGHSCLTCGMTRAFCSVSHRQLTRAWDYNKMSIPAYATFIGLSLFLTGSLIRYTWFECRIEGNRGHD